MLLVKGFWKEYSKQMPGTKKFESDDMKPHLSIKGFHFLWSKESLGMRLGITAVCWR